MKKILLILVLTAIFFGACSTPSANLVNDAFHGHADILEAEISPSLLAEKLQKKEKFVLLDVREQNEYEKSHIPGTTHLISVKELSLEKLKDSKIEPDDEIVIYCRSGNRSRIGANLLRSLGYTKVRELNSGIIHWMEDGYKVEKGADMEKSTSVNESASYATGAKIAFDREIHDFGKIKQFGGTVSTAFRVKNIGTENLKIGEIATSCSCTKAKIDKRELPPNSSAILTVIFDPNIHEEPKDAFKRTIFIPTNDSSKPEAELIIQVDILEGQ